MSMQKPQRRVVRAGGLDRFMEDFRDEMGAKVGESLVTYHERFVTPLEERLAWLETPIWLRWLRRVEGWFR
jgi:hypothetical protein